MPVSAQKPTLKNRIRSTDVTKVAAERDLTQRLANALVTWVRDRRRAGVDIRGSGGWDRSTAACSLKHVVNFAIERLCLLAAARSAAASCDWSCGVTVAIASCARLGEQTEEHHADNRDADGAAELLKRRQHAGRGPGVAPGHARQDDVEQRRDHRPEAEPADDE